MTSHTAVLTGDIVKSSRIDPARQRHLGQTMDAAIRGLREALGHAVVPDPPVVFRGDSWQHVSHFRLQR